MTRKPDYNRRSFPRQNLTFPMHVECRTTGREFGQILDISLEGTRMLCTAPVKRGENYELSFRMPGESGKDELLVFEAKSIWTCPDKRTGYSLSGFKLLSFWQKTQRHVALSSAISEYEAFLSEL